MTTDNETLLTGAADAAPEESTGTEGAAPAPDETPTDEPTGEPAEGEYADEGGEPDDSLETYADFNMPEGVTLDSATLDAAPSDVIYSANN